MSIINSLLITILSMQSLETVKDEFFRFHSNSLSLVVQATDNMKRNRLPNATKFFEEAEKWFNEQEDQMHNEEMHYIKRMVAECRGSGKEKEAKEWEELGKKFEKSYQESLEARKKRAQTDYQKEAIKLCKKEIASLGAAGKPTEMWELALKLLIQEQAKKELLINISKVRQLIPKHY